MWKNRTGIRMCEQSREESFSDSAVCKVKCCIWLRANATQNDLKATTPHQWIQIKHQGVKSIKTIHLCYVCASRDIVACSVSTILLAGASTKTHKEWSEANVCIAHSHWIALQGVAQTSSGSCPAAYCNLPKGELPNQPCPIAQDIQVYWPVPRNIQRTDWSQTMLGCTYCPWCRPVTGPLSPVLNFCKLSWPVPRTRF